ncbi:hypothetical protein ACFZC3_15340 [Streptomyces sp. NPDC007903]|uniref:hypothetical protein n=1 Tax=Streptomyces sp. NPDC007903 TaxID=3364786 RepID=UPI0036EB5B06
MSPRPESVAAADWWAQRLSKPIQHDVGAAESNTLANGVAALVRRQRTQAQIESFRQALVDGIESHVSQYEWRPTEPERGSYMRSIGVDHGPDKVLADAAEVAGFELRMLDLPMKTVMWINPGIVSVAEGHAARRITIWKADHR